MDVTLFYALFSATCFTLVGLWWGVLDRRGDLMAHPSRRREVGTVYLAFLLPALMGMFAQIGGTTSPGFWRVSFVVIALVGAAAVVTVGSSASGGRLLVRCLHWVLAAVYVLVAAVGLFPSVAVGLGVTPLQVEGSLLVLLVATGHALVWEFVGHRPGEAGPD